MSYVLGRIRLIQWWKVLIRPLKKFRGFLFPCIGALRWLLTRLFALRVWCVQIVMWCIQIATAVLGKSYWLEGIGRMGLVMLQLLFIVVGFSGSLKRCLSMMPIELDLWAQLHVIIDIRIANAFSTFVHLQTLLWFEIRFSRLGVMPAVIPELAVSRISRVIQILELARIWHMKTFTLQASFMVVILTRCFVPVFVISVLWPLQASLLATWRSWTACPSLCRLASWVA